MQPADNWQPKPSRGSINLNHKLMMEEHFELSGNIVDVVAGRIFPGTVIVKNGTIAGIREEPVSSGVFILPGLIDAHIHIESSMLVPSEFARLAVIHGTVATVSDPHEIANVLGIPGVEYMIENGAKVPFRFYFGAPSCVPATPFETAGAVLGVEEVKILLEKPEIKYLSEMMNFPGVLFGDPEVIAKLELARKAGKPVDGHAPGVTGADAEKYVGAGISTDHECFTIEEAREKIALGMKILLREGSAARNFEALWPLIDEAPEMVMLCSDDKHPNDLLEGHINTEVKRALHLDLDPMNVLRCCTLNPVRHYGLDSGLLQTGDSADFIVVGDLRSFQVLQTFVKGQKVAENGVSLISSVVVPEVNLFNAGRILPEDLQVPAHEGDLRVIEAFDGQLITAERVVKPKIRDGFVVADPEQNVIKLVVMNRYQPVPPAIGFIFNTGMQRGAIASCVAHDSHNIVAAGVDDASIAEAINLIVEHKGGISLADGEVKEILPLPVAGIMTGDDGFAVASLYDKMDKLARRTGIKLSAPYMTLSFMALLVIPELKLSDKGLFDGKKFTFSSLFRK